MSFWDNLGNVVAVFFWIFVSVAYLITLFSVVGDLFRDQTLKGGYKAVWVLFLLFVPILTVLAYLIFRGQGMGQRQVQAARDAQTAADSYIKTVAGLSPADEITKAKSLLDAGTITTAEFNALKAHALTPTSA